MDGDQIVPIQLRADRSDDATFRGVTALTAVAILDDDGSLAEALPALRFNDEMWFVRKSTGAIDRFSLQTQTWLSPVIPDGRIGHPTAAYVDQSGIFLAFGRTVFRYQLDGTHEVRFADVPQAVHAIHSDEDILFLNHSSDNSANRQEPLLIVSSISGSSTVRRSSPQKTASSDGRLNRFLATLCS